MLKNYSDKQARTEKDKKKRRRTVAAETEPEKQQAERRIQPDDMPCYHGGFEDIGASNSSDGDGS